MKTFYAFDWHWEANLWSWLLFVLSFSSSKSRSPW